MYVYSSILQKYFEMNFPFDVIIDKGRIFCCEWKYEFFPALLQSYLIMENDQSLSQFINSKTSSYNILNISWLIEQF